MTPITGRNDSLNGLVAFGATVKDLSNNPLGAQSYRYKNYFDALSNGTVTWPCMIAALELEPQLGFQTLAQMGNGGVDQFNVVHMLLHYKVSGGADFTIKEPDVVTMLDHHMVALGAFAAGGGWAVVNHGKVDQKKPMPALKMTLEDGISYHVSIFVYAVTIYL